MEHGVGPHASSVLTKASHPQQVLGTVISAAQAWYSDVQNSCTHEEQFGSVNSKSCGTSVLHQFGQEPGIPLALELLDEEVELLDELELLLDDEELEELFSEEPELPEPPVEELELALDVTPVDEVVEVEPTAELELLDAPPRPPGQPEQEP